MERLLSDCAACRMVRRAGAIELVIGRCVLVAQTVWLRTSATSAIAILNDHDRQRSYALHFSISAIISSTLDAARSAPL
jgi:hypothetical protein